MSEFLLLYRSTNEAHQAVMGSPEKARETMAKWRVWFDDMTAKGQEPGSAIATDGPGRPGPGKLCHRWSVRRDEGGHRRILDHRGARFHARGGDRLGVSDRGTRRLGRSASGDGPAGVTIRG